MDDQNYPSEEFNDNESLVGLLDPTVQVHNDVSEILEKKDKRIAQLEEQLEKLTSNSEQEGRRKRLKREEYEAAALILFGLIIILVFWYKLSVKKKIEVKDIEDKAKTSTESLLLVC